MAVTFSATLAAEGGRPPRRSKSARLSRRIGIPLTRTAIARERADIDRALTPLVSVPLEQLQTPAGRTLDVSIPNDDQWKRIAKRVGSPSFLLVPASTRTEPSDQTYAIFLSALAGRKVVG
jgi:hypothetical protein